MIATSWGWHATSPPGNETSSRSRHEVRAAVTAIPHESASEQLGVDDLPGDSVAHAGADVHRETVGSSAKPRSYRRASARSWSSNRRMGKASPVDRSSRTARVQSSPAAEAPSPAPRVTNRSRSPSPVTVRTSSGPAREPTPDGRSPGNSKAFQTTPPTADHSVRELLRGHDTPELFTPVLDDVQCRDRLDSEREPRDEEPLAVGADVPASYG
jgi:hypothetical protein